MSRYSDINPMDLDPETGRPYSNYSSPSLDTSFHDLEMVGEEDGSWRTQQEADGTWSVYQGEAFRKGGFAWETMAATWMDGYRAATEPEA